MRTRDLLGRWPPAPPADVLDVGGGTARTPSPLAAEGHRVRRPLAS